MEAFREFEALLRERFPDPGERGHAFEPVAKWLLETHPVYSEQLRRVWAFAEWPGCWGGAEPMPTTV